MSHPGRASSSPRDRFLPAAALAAASLLSVVAVLATVILVATRAQAQVDGHDLPPALLTVARPLMLGTWTLAIAAWVAWMMLRRPTHTPPPRRPARVITGEWSPVPPRPAAPAATEVLPTPAPGQWSTPVRVPAPSTRATPGVAPRDGGLYRSTAMGGPGWPTGDRDEIRRRLIDAAGAEARLMLTEAFRLGRRMNTKKRNDSS